MKKFYTITTILAVDDRNDAAVIEKARRLFTTNIPTVRDKDENGVRQLGREEQFVGVDCVTAALMDIMSFQPKANNDIMEIVTMIAHEQLPEQVQHVKTPSEPRARSKRRRQR